MARIIIEYSIKIPRGGIADFTLSADPADIMSTDEALSASDVTAHVKTTLGLTGDGIAQVKVLNARDVVAAWKAAKAKAAKAKAA